MTRPGSPQAWASTPSIIRANRIFPDEPASRELHEVTARLFEDLFLTGKGDLLADEVQAVLIVFGCIVSDAADTRVHACAAQGFAVDDLSHCSLHEIRTAEAHEAYLFDHDDDIAEGG